MATTNGDDKWRQQMAGAAAYALSSWQLQCAGKDLERLEEVSRVNLTVKVIQI